MRVRQQWLRGFPPVADGKARVLILGSMPGAESLRRRQYYAHPRNPLWDFMGILFGAGRELNYPRRLARLRAAGVALWDVTRRCRRPGSLDANIEPASVTPNDFNALFKRCPQIRAVFFNGAKAAELFRRRVLPGLEPWLGRPVLRVLPSTSPAHAALSRAAKLARWRQIKRWLR